MWSLKNFSDAPLKQGPEKTFPYVDLRKGKGKKKRENMPPDLELLLGLESLNKKKRLFNRQVPSEAHYSIGRHASRGENTQQGQTAEQYAQRRDVKHSGKNP